jgi:predicted nucleic acid-binding protein
MYLLDTTVASDLVNPSCSGFAAAQAFMQANLHHRDRIYVCVVTVAEMEFGLELFKRSTTPPPANEVAEVEQRIDEARQISEPFIISRHVAKEHALLKAKWARHVAPLKADKRKLKSMPVERWVQDWPASKLQITENDLWIAAVALTHDLTLVARDKDFERLRSPAGFKLHLLSSTA